MINDYLFCEQVLIAYTEINVNTFKQLNLQKTFYLSMLKINFQSLIKNGKGHSDIKFGCTFSLSALEWALIVYLTLVWCTV